jgi:hypothetical protein
MKFVAGGINGEYLKTIHLSSKGNTDSIKIAIAYASAHPEILEDNLKNNVKISFWGRYDASVPITTILAYRISKPKRFLDQVVGLLPGQVVLPPQKLLLNGRSRYEKQIMLAVYPVNQRRIYE